MAAFSKWYKWPILTRLLACYAFYIILSVTITVTNLNDIFEIPRNDQDDLLNENVTGSYLVCEKFNKTGEWCSFHIHEMLESIWAIILNVTGAAMLIYILVKRDIFFDQSHMRLGNPFKIKLLSFLTVGVLCENAVSIFIMMTSTVYDWYNPIIGKRLLITSNCSSTFYYMTLLIFIHATTRFPLKESLTTRILLSVNLGCVTCFWWFQWVSNFLDLGEFYLQYESPHDEDLQKFIRHLDNFSRVFALQASFLAFEQLYRVWGAVYTEKTVERANVTSPLTSSRRRTTGIINDMYDAYEPIDSDDNERNLRIERKTVFYGNYEIEQEFHGASMSSSRTMVAHGLCGAFQLVRIVVGYLISLNLTTQASLAALSIELANHVIAICATAKLVHLCVKSPRKIKAGGYNLYDVLLNAYALGPFIFYIGSIICNSYFFFIPNHSAKFQQCLDQLGSSANFTDKDLNVLSFVTIFDNFLAIVNVLFTNFAVIYLARRRLTLEQPNARFWIIIIQYYYALKWISEGWLAVDIAATRPLQTCVTPKSVIFKLASMVLVLHSWQAWEMFNLVSSRKCAEYYVGVKHN